MVCDLLLHPRATPGDLVVADLGSLVVVSGCIDSHAATGCFHRHHKLLDPSVSHWAHCKNILWAADLVVALLLASHGASTMKLQFLVPAVLFGCPRAARFELHECFSLAFLGLRLLLRCSRSPRVGDAKCGLLRIHSWFWVSGFSQPHACETSRVRPFWFPRVRWSGQVSDSCICVRQVLHEIRKLCVMTTNWFLS